MGLLKGFETAFQTFNNYLSNITRKRNATIVGPSRQITGEFPEVTAQRLFEYYHGWDQIKRSIDTMHQKFMGSGIVVKSKSTQYDAFMKKWFEVTNFQKKMSDFFLSVFITGNAILEKQFTEDGRIGNVSVVPMQTIYRIFRDEFGNELKLVQNIDGIFKELDPQFYVHWAINNPDRQAFGKSEFHTLAAPRKVVSKIDVQTGEAINPERNLVPLLDAQVELQNAEVEIKRLMAKPRIFASFPGMPQSQLAKLQKELQDESSSQTIWAFDKEARMAEATYSDRGKFQEYGNNVDSHIDIGTGFASKVISHPGGFSYSSSQTPFDVLDQRMIDLQSDAREMIRDQILRPIAQSWGINNFDDLEVEISFRPTVRRLTMEDIQRLPLDSVSPNEKRAILKSLHIPLDDKEFSDFKNSGQQNNLLNSGGGKNTTSPISAPSPSVGSSDKIVKPDSQKNRPMPPRTDSVEIHRIYSEPVLLESYVNDIIERKFTHERITLSPQKNSGDMFMPGGLREEHGDPEITDVDIEDQILARFDDEKKWRSENTEINVDELIEDEEESIYSDQQTLKRSHITDNVRDNAGSISTPYPETDASGIPIKTPDDPQRTRSNRYPDLNGEDSERRKKINEFLKRD